MSRDLDAPVSRRPPGRLLVRVLSGTVMGLAVLGLLLARPYGLYVIVAVVGGLALWEFRDLSGHIGFRAPAWLLYPLGVYFCFSGTLLSGVGAELVLGASLIVGLIAFLFLPGTGQGLGRWAMGVAGALYIGIPFDFYLRLYASPAGTAWVILTLAAVTASDSAALLIGLRFGRRPFFPRVSPKKTLEGAAGGVAVAVLVMLVGGLLGLGLAPWHGIALGVLAGIAAIAGDLVESQMKRIAEVKDSSRLIPGHGGVLDRIDSILFAGIAVYFYALSLHLLR